MEQELIAEVKGKNYALILQEEGFKVATNEYYLTVGQIPEAIEWPLYLSVVQPHVHFMLERLFALLRREKIAMSMPKTSEFVDFVLQGKMGYKNFGKVITLYPTDVPQTLRVTDELLKLTDGINGPKLPTAAPLGGILYTQYRGVTPFKHEMWPFSIPMPKGEKQKNHIFKSKYMIYDIMKRDLKGDVFKGIYLKGFMRVGWCVIKQGRQYMWTDNGNRSMKDRLEWQVKLQQKLQGLLRMPKIYDTVTFEGDTYVIMEYLRGTTYHRAVRKIYGKKKTWQNITRSKQKQLITVLLKIIGEVQKLHSQGYIHRDITPANFMVNHRNEISLIDLELTYSLKDSYPLPVFGMGTGGYMSYEQFCGEVPTAKEDIFSIGGLISFTFTGKSPQELEFLEANKFTENMRIKGVDNEIIELAIACYDEDPSRRPELVEIMSTLHIFSDQQNIGQ